MAKRGRKPANKDQVMWVPPFGIYLSHRERALKNKITALKAEILLIDTELAGVREMKLLVSKQMEH